MDARSSAFSKSSNSSDHIWDVNLMKEELDEIERLDPLKLKSNVKKMIEVWEVINESIEKLIAKDEKNGATTTIVNVSTNKHEYAVSTNMPKLRELMKKLGNRSGWNGRKNGSLCSCVPGENSHEKTSNHKPYQRDFRSCFLSRRPVGSLRVIRR
ncbi:unnamed protein product [Litomosoides sigmodontis]|uniref:Uncharacterized protein n=1 Tax=Litomosoides sigmodontis TaxID=42156 RepID=A0A3P7JKJ3_LITSI|nr:unnamed protein product [Litomosoides sigmodontis]